jgi:hypothetical protein
MLTSRVKWKPWSVEDTNRALLLHKKGLSMNNIARHMGLTKNAVMGRLHRLRIKNGHIPNSGIKKGLPPLRKNIMSKFRSSYFKKIGRQWPCNICSKKFDMRSRFDRFCPSCDGKTGENYYY